VKMKILPSMTRKIIAVMKLWTRLALDRHR